MKNGPIPQLLGGGEKKMVATDFHGKTNKQTHPRRISPDAFSMSVKGKSRTFPIFPSLWFQGTIGRTPNSVPMVFIVFSRDSWG